MVINHGELPVFIEAVARRQFRSVFVEWNTSPEKRKYPIQKVGCCIVLQKYQINCVNGVLNEKKLIPHILTGRN